MRIRKKYTESFKDITERLKAIRTLRPGEPPEFPATQRSILASVLESAVDFNPQIPGVDRPSVLNRAVSNAAKQTDLTPEVLRSQLHAAESAYLKIPVGRFVLATSVGIRGYRGLKTISVNGVRISLVPSLPKRFTRSSIADRVEATAHIPSDLVHVLARVSARTPTAAFNAAQTGLDLIRALWNLTLISGSYRVLHLGLPRPTNLILPGTVHTLHQTDGTLIEDMFWVESQPLKEGWIYFARENWPSIEKRTLKLRSSLRAIRYQQDIEKVLVRYVRALDDADPRSSFKRVWSVLEYLVHSVGDYNALIRRACFLASDDERDLIRMLLEHLRDVRNATVHGDEERINILVYLEQARLVTERLIRFHPQKSNPFGSLAIAAGYLDTPTDRRLLQEGIRNYRRALLRK